MPDNDALAVEAQRLRAAQAFGRSEPLARLFDFLLDRSLSGRTPKEIEVAQDVFGRDAGFDVMQDASVRVYIHRLRRKLEEFYAREAEPPRARLEIPRGEYRFVLTVDDTLPVDDSAGLSEAEPLQVPRRQPPWRWFFVAAAALSLLLAGALVWVLATRPPQDAEVAAARAATLWQPIVNSNRPTVIAVGDYYIFGDAEDGMEVTRLVREFAVNSARELEQHLQQAPDHAGHDIDLGLTYAPVGALPAIREILPIIDRPGRPAVVLPMSAVTGEIVRRFNIVYLGYLSGLGPLRDELFAASRFRVGESYDELIDKRSGRRFDADWSVVSRGGTPRTDYAYLASFPGPTDTRITVIAGTRDAALRQAAEIAADAGQLARIDAQVKGVDLEALYRVSSLATSNLGGQLIAASPMNGRAAWRRSTGRGQAFPDQLRVGGPP